MHTTDTSNLSSSKAGRHRERLRKAGLRPVQFWVPDTRMPEFAETVRHQCLALRGDAMEIEAIGFAMAASDLVEGWN